MGEISLRAVTGPAKQAYHLTQGLANKGIENIVYTFFCSGFKNHPKIRVKLFKPIIRIGHYRPSLNMLSNLLKEQGDIVHVHGYRNFQTDIGALLSNIKDIPLVMTAHGSIATFKQEYWSSLGRLQNCLYDIISTRFALRQASAIVATTKQEAKEIIEFGVPARKVRIIPHGLHLPQVKGRSIQQNNTTILLTVSRLTYKNNLELGIRGFAKAVRVNPNLKYVIVGDEKPSKYAKEERGYKKKLLKLCKQLNIRDKVMFTGWLTGKALWNMYEKADIFVWTSRYDNFGHALVEAAHFGLPIISTPVGVAPEIIDKEKGGFLINHEDDEALAQKILELARKRSLRLKMREHNIKKAKSYTVDKMVQRYEQLYLELTVQ
ncbi:MAG: glycosyltransferase family 4 protein [Candidatus Odinarchaeota archaeon]|nr:glycosyltransferase family 4 protein [Candidatus Odinarchaeota archaeon]